MVRGLGLGPRVKFKVRVRLVVLCEMISDYTPKTFIRIRVIVSVRIWGA
jgi:hypothetical protein